MELTEIITMLRAKLAEIWNEHQDDPESGRLLLGMWKEEARKRISRFSPDRANEFWFLHGNPHGEIEDKAEREYKIFQSEVREYDHYLDALQKHCESFPNFGLVEVDNTIDLQLRKPGRPSDPLYDEAFQRILEGESEKSAFAWFCDKAKIENPDKGVRDSFKAALKRRQKKT